MWNWGLYTLKIRAAKKRTKIFHAPFSKKMAYGLSMRPDKPAQLPAGGAVSQARLFPIGRSRCKPYAGHDWNQSGGLFRLALPTKSTQSAAVPSRH